MMRFLHALLAALFSTVTAPFRWLGFGGPPNAAAAMAAAALSDPAANDDDVVDESAFAFGCLVREHARRRIQGTKPGEPALAPLPPLVEAWMNRLERSQVLGLWRIPARMVERHVTGGSEGRLKSEFGLVTPEAVMARPIVAQQAVAGAAGKGGSSSGGNRNKPAAEAASAATEIYLEDMFAAAGMSMDECLATGPRR